MRPRATRTLRMAWALVGVVLVVSGCGDENNRVAAPSEPIQLPEELFSSTLAPRGTSSRSFTLPRAGTIAVTLVNSDTTIGLGVGLPRTSGGGCRLGVAVSTGGGSAPQISVQADPGQYCVQVYDLGTLTEPIAFSLKVDHP